MTKRILTMLAVISIAAAAWAAPAERYLHVRVDDAAKQQKIHISLPLSVAAKMIPAIDHGSLRDGKIRVGSFEANGVDVMQVLEALKTAPDGEFLTIEQRGRTLRVAKQNGMLIVHVASDEEGGKRVDVSVPWVVAAALISSGNSHELNVDAAIQALGRSGNTAQVTVSSERRVVSVWVDSQSTMQEPAGESNRP